LPEWLINWTERWSATDAWCSPSSGFPAIGQPVIGGQAAGVLRPFPQRFPAADRDA
jgi:hypothetical protein